jgi:hypothetical protein
MWYRWVYYELSYRYYRVLPSTTGHYRALSTVCGVRACIDRSVTQMFIPILRCSPFTANPRWTSLQPDGSPIVAVTIHRYFKYNLLSLSLITLPRAYARASARAQINAHIRTHARARARARREARSGGVDRTSDRRRRRRSDCTRGQQCLACHGRVSLPRTPTHTRTQARARARTRARAHTTSARHNPAGGPHRGARGEAPSVRTGNRPGTRRQRPCHERWAVVGCATTPRAGRRNADGVRA